MHTVSNNQIADILQCNNFSYLRVYPLPWSRTAVDLLIVIWKVAHFFNTLGSDEGHLTIFYVVVNITLNRHYDILCQLQIHQIDPGDNRWLRAFRNIMALLLSSILYLAVPLYVI